MPLWYVPRSTKPLPSKSPTMGYPLIVPVNRASPASIKPLRLVSKYQVVPSNSPISSPLAALPSKLPATGSALKGLPLVFGGWMRSLITLPVSSSEHPAIVAVGVLSVGRQFGKAVGCARFVYIWRSEIAGENLVAAYIPNCR